MRGPIIAAVAAVLMLTGCVSYDSSDAIKQMPADLVHTAKVGAITVKSVPSDVTPTFQPALEKALRERLTACAKGNTELSLEVSVSVVKVRNVGKAILLGDSSVVKGQARFFKPGSSDIVADFDISHSVGGGGILPAVAMAGEEVLADDFAVELCSQAFKSTPKHH